jgi:hypothetical protein
MLSAIEQQRDPIADSRRTVDSTAAAEARFPDK